MADTADITELRGIYGEMDTEGKRKLVVSASLLLDAQKAIKKPPALSDSQPVAGSFANSGTSFRAD
jgi:hypothetical protein